jgi:GAF domain-containing protein
MSSAEPAPSTPPDLEETLYLIVSTARAALPGLDQVGVWLLDDDGHPHTRVAAGDLVWELDRLQLELDEGPCLDALRTVPVVVASQLDIDRRWPRYVSRAVDLGVRSQLAVRLVDAGRTVGGMNVYSTHSPGIDPETAGVAELFATQASVALVQARQVDGLRQALDTRTTIGQAVGILMSEYTLTAEAAFAYLVRASSHANIKLREIAARVVGDADARAETAAGGLGTD